MTFIYGALSAAILWGIVILARQTIYGLRGTATKRSVIICTAVHGVFGLCCLGTAIAGLITGVTSLGLLLVFGFITLPLAFVLVKRNFIDKKKQGDQPDAADSKAVDDKNGDSAVESNRWVCPGCGRKNYNYSRSCICGCKRPKQKIDNTAAKE